MSEYIPRLMIDFETAGTGAKAPILTLGAVNFCCPPIVPRTMFYARVLPQDNEQWGRHIQKETLDWWDKQDPAARIEAFGGVQTLKFVLEDFERHCKQTVAYDLASIEVWSRGAGFDCEILQDAFYSVLGYYPFDFRKHMCQRTVEALMPVDLKELVPKNTMKHNALEDAMYQANVIEMALRNLVWNKPKEWGGL